MEQSVPLLDTPKKLRLQSQADELRTALKDFERNFAAEHKGQKPGREDIKANAEIQNKYSEYSKLRNVLDGKLSIEVLNPLSQQEQNIRHRQRRHRRTDSAISLKPHTAHPNQTPSKRRYHPSQLDPYDAPRSASPKVILNEIGPTPHRNGTILGIFDMLYASGGSRKSSQQTPVRSKRKRDALHDDIAEGTDLQGTMAQTPRHNRADQSASQGNHLASTTPTSGPATGRRNHSKTPVSDSKRFMLQHFFTTPSAVRFATMLQDETTPNAKTPAENKTPLRDQVLGISPAKGHVAAVDATPPYLKRSFSFKERLLSASGNTASPSSPQRKTGPASARTLGTRRTRQTRFTPKPLSQIIADRVSQQIEVPHASNDDEFDDDHDDDEDDDDELDALREIELQENPLLVGDGQRNHSQAPGVGAEEQGRVWKKKGQKRTTRRAIMRPTKMKPAEAPKFVAADDDDDGDLTDHEISRVEETQYMPDDAFDVGPEPDDDELEYLIAETERADDENPPQQHRGENTLRGNPRVGHDDANKKNLEDAFPPDPPEYDSDVYFDDDDDDDDDDLHRHHLESPVKKRKESSKSKSRSKQTQAKSKKPPHDIADEDGSGNGNANVTRKINPNAQSHMNFRSLKIRNKNSKAKGAAGRGKGRFGRGRR